MTLEADTATEPDPPAPTEEEKRDNVIRLAFGGDAMKFQKFCDVLRDAIPAGTAAVLRGSAVTGQSWRDGHPFDGHGPGTSDLDVTLLGEDAIKLFKITGFFVPGVHSRPVSEDDPEIAPDLIPVREHLMKMAGRPVNIQASRNFVMFLRGDVLGQPYLTLIEGPGEAAAENP